MKKMFDLALKIQNNFKNFYLAGGTSIMFKYKHRKSIDLDFFSYKEFSFNRLSTKIRNLYTIEQENKFIDNIDFFIDGIKVSFVYFPFKNIKKLQNLNNLKMANDYDLFLNKIYVAGRRIDTKDPFDVAFLYKKYKWSIKIIKKDFNTKFPEQNFELFLGALLNFKDYENLTNETIQTLKGLI